MKTVATDFSSDSGGGDEGIGRVEFDNAECVRSGAIGGGGDDGGEGEIPFASKGGWGLLCEFF